MNFCSRIRLLVSADLETLGKSLIGKHQSYFVLSLENFTLAAVAAESDGLATNFYLRRRIQLLTGEDTGNQTGLTRHVKLMIGFCRKLGCVTSESLGAVGAAEECFCALVSHGMVSFDSLARNRTLDAVKLHFLGTMQRST